MQCLSGCGQYRPNVTPNTERAVGSRDRTARQSLDCLRVRTRYTSIRFISRIGASLLLAPIVSNTWLSGIALHIAVRAKGFGWQGCGSALCQFQESIVHASYASHTSHLQSASREAPHLAIGFPCSIQSAKLSDGRKNAPALNRRDGDLPPAIKLADGRILPPAQENGVVRFVS